MDESSKVISLSNQSSPDESAYRGSVWAIVRFVLEIEEDNSELCKSNGKAMNS